MGDPPDSVEHGVAGLEVDGDRRDVRDTDPAGEVGV
jgi:hypothetical protein